MHRGQPGDGRQRIDANSVRGYERVSTYIHCLGLPLKRSEAGWNVCGLPNFEYEHLNAECTSHRANFVHLQEGGGIANISQDRQTAETRDHLAKEFESFSGNIGRLERKSRDVSARPRQTFDQTAADRIVRYREDNRDNRCRLL